MSRILYHSPPIFGSLCHAVHGFLVNVANGCYFKADRDGKMCYLNTAQYEPNVAIYERLGFKVGKFAQVKVEDDFVEVGYRQTSLTCDRRMECFGNHDLREDSMIIGFGSIGQSASRWRETLTVHTS